MAVRLGRTQARPVPEETGSETLFSGTGILPIVFQTGEVSSSSFKLGLVLNYFSMFQTECVSFVMEIRENRMFRLAAFSPDNEVGG